MKTTKTHILLGLGVLGASTLLGAVQPVQAAPIWGQGQYRRDNRDSRPNRRPSNNTFSTLRGRVTQDYRGDTFALRTDNGRNVTVRVLGGESRRISRNDRVQVTGRYVGNAFQTRGVTILRNR